MPAVCLLNAWVCVALGVIFDLFKHTDTSIKTQMHAGRNTHLCSSSPVISATFMWSKGGTETTHYSLLQALSLSSFNSLSLSVLKCKTLSDFIWIKLFCPHKCRSCSEVKRECGFGLLFSTVTQAVFVLRWCHSRVTLWPTVLNIWS